MLTEGKERKRKNVGKEREKIRKEKENERKRKGRENIRKEKERKKRKEKTGDNSKHQENCGHFVNNAPKKSHCLNLQNLQKKKKKKERILKFKVCNLHHFRYFSC